MRPRIRPLATLTVPLLTIACAGEAPSDDQREPAPPGDARPTAEADTPTAADPDADRPVCLQGTGFAADGPLPNPANDSADTAAIGAGSGRTITGLRWAAHGGCERVVIDLAGPDGEPAATTGAVTAEVLRSLGVVRIHLRDVPQVESEATDTSFEGTLAGSAFAVRSPDGRWMYVDLHLAGPAEARMTVTAAPARVVVDLRPGGGPLPGPAPRSTRVVVLEPRGGAASYPLRVRGYARTFEATVAARIEQQGVEVADTFTTATAWADAWGHYELTFLEGPAGPVTLHVGEHSARDGSWVGVAVELE